MTGHIPEKCEVKRIETTTDRTKTRRLTATHDTKTTSGCCETD
jgi:hypothetical protein